MVGEILLAGFLIAGIWACGGGGGDDPLPVLPEPEVKLEVNPGTVEAVAGDGTYTVNVTASSAWSATCDSGWCRPLQSGSTLTLKVSANPFARVRTAGVKVTMASLSRTVTVKQEAAVIPEPEEELSIGQPDIAASWPAKEYTVAVAANVEWSAGSDQSWCTVAKENDTLRISLELNKETAGRTAVITVCGVKLKQTLTVTQTGITLRGLDSLALVDIADSTGGSKWKEAWNRTQSLSGWKGVQLDVAGERVERLSLRGNRLEGVFPQALARLTALRRLDLGNNGLTGELPAGIGDLLQLEELSLDSNRLSGNLPQNMNRLTKLRILDLGYNDFSGSLPEGMSSLTALSWLRLAGNDFSGTLPETWKAMKALVVLDISMNRFMGVIPVAWLDEMYKMEYFYLYGNELEQSIPEEIVGLYALKALGLDNNRLTGSIPGELGDLPSLTGLWLYNNELSGTLPASLTSHRLWETWKSQVCPQRGTGFEDGCPPAVRSGGVAVVYPLPDKNRF